MYQPSGLSSLHNEELQVRLPPSPATQSEALGSHWTTLQKMREFSELTLGGETLTNGLEAESRGLLRVKTPTRTAPGGDTGEGIEKNNFFMDAVPADATQISAAAVSSLTPKGSLKGYMNALYLYMGATHVSPEEKSVVSSIIEALVCYTQSRLRLKQYIEDGEACLQQFANLRDSVDSAIAGLRLSAQVKVGDGSFFQPLSNAMVNTANGQRGRAKVDTDLAECRQQLQQVEAFARTLQDLQSRWTRLCEILELGGDGQGRGQGQRPSTGSSTHTDAPVSLLQSTMDECVSRLRQEWDAVMTSAAKNFTCVLSEGHFQDVDRGAQDKGHGYSLNNVWMLTSLRQLSDNASSRIETMRSRITRLGSSRIEEAEALEKRLLTMDQYDPAAEEHVGRRRQIEMELEELRSWLGNIGQLRKRAMATTEMLQHCSINGGCVSGISGRSSPCLQPYAESGSAVSSCRPSTTRAFGSLDEWRQTLATANPIVTNNTTTAYTENARMFSEPRDSRDGIASSSGAFAPALSGSGGKSETGADFAKGDFVNSFEHQQQATSTTITATATTTTAEPIFTTDSSAGNNENGLLGVVDKEDNFNPRLINSFNDGVISSFEVKNKTNIDREYSNTSNNNNDDDDDDGDATSCYHENAFDTENEAIMRKLERRQSRKQKRSFIVTYLDGIKSFAKAVVQRAAQFSDAEDEEDTASSDDCDNYNRQKRRLERGVNA